MVLGLAVAAVTTVGLVVAGPSVPQRTTVGAVPPPSLGPAPPVAVVAPPSPASGPLTDAGLHVSMTICPLPALGTTNEALEAWVQEAVTCLDAAWQPVLVSAGVSPRRPAVRRYRDQLRTRCRGELATNAFYCGADEVIGVSPSRELSPLPDADRPGWLLGILAHEYGHHVQELAGILTASDATQPYRPGEPAWLETNRRVELQATCFAGVAIASMAGPGSVGPGEVATARWRLGGGDDATPGGVRNHGTTAHNQLWFDRGLQAGSPAACNTWAASADEVE